MRIPRLHVDATLKTGATLEIDGNTFQHITRVLRLKPGAQLIVFNGADGEYRALLNAVDRKTCKVTVGEYRDHSPESPLQITLIQGVSRGERMDYTLQKSTELGVSVIRPLITERTVVRIDEQRTAKRMAHWQKIVVGACEQSGRTRVPDVLEPLTMAQWLGLAKPGADEMALVLDGNGNQSLPMPAACPRQVSVVVGPEGGLTEEEVAACNAHGYTPARLGPRTLRTETAAVTALSIIQFQWGDLAQNELAGC